MKVEKIVSYFKWREKDRTYIYVRFISDLYHARAFWIDTKKWDRNTKNKPEREESYLKKLLSTND